ncbi:Asp23/Gls24 family envelope stress response protein [Agrilactobacillus fermenti]|uniref:Asp23/Gls24 family envelope stress response protein n=1 Tax=Agrilactobacillus fermenti TaxID=2586909 RepID=UPI001E5D973A|nr:Asp23/Gls24 family envelope stress response protein [Agrilactobacillus fermenti]MCD2256205.1 Asp23/Gls24 family envelope stress response protein [Agrilactobacillus fermenti]
MAENTNIVLQELDNGKGRIEIAPEVLEVLLGIAASQIEGVYEMRGTLKNNINEWFGHINHGKGVSVSLVDGHLFVDVYAYLRYGVSVPKVAMSMQKTLKEQLLYMTDLVIDQINIHVVGVIPEKAAPTIDPNSLFTDDTIEDTEDGKDS